MIVLQITLGFLVLCLLGFVLLTRNDWLEPAGDLEQRVDDFHARIAHDWFGDEIEDGADWAWERAQVVPDVVRDRYREAS